MPRSLDTFGLRRYLASFSKELHLIFSRTIVIFNISLHENSRKIRLGVVPYRKGSTMGSS